jgi:hypothetical protein
MRGPQFAASEARRIAKRVYPYPGRCLCGQTVVAKIAGAPKIGDFALPFYIETTWDNDNDWRRQYLLQKLQDASRAIPRLTWFIGKDKGT